MTSVPSISRLRIRAWAPVSFMVSPGEGPDRRWSGRENPPHLRRARRTDASEPYAYVMTTRRSAIRYMRSGVSPRSARDSSHFIVVGRDDQELAVTGTHRLTVPAAEDRLDREAHA